MQPMIKRKKKLSARLSENRKLQSLLTVLLPVLFGILIFELWEGGILNSWMNIDAFTLPSPSRINGIIAGNIGKIMTNVWATVLVAVLGLLIGSVIGYAIAILAALYTEWGIGGLMIVAAFNAIPAVALAPVMTNWTKDVSSDANIRSMAAKILVVMIVSIANMSINAYRGLTELKPYSDDLMSTYAASKGETLVKLRLPNSIPYIFTALRVGVPSSVIIAVVSEYFAEYVIGVGRQIRENIVTAQYSTAWAYIVVACLIGIVMYIILLVAEGILLRKRA
jgi:NitT/TauT family transport system permease protein